MAAVSLKVKRHSAQWYARQTVRNLVVYGLLIGLGAIFILPFLWSVTSSLRAPNAPLSFPPQSPPRSS